jgi:hypothetical protein
MQVTTSVLPSIASLLVVPCSAPASLLDAICRLYRAGVQRMGHKFAGWDRVAPAPDRAIEVG